MTVKHPKVKYVMRGRVALEDSKGESHQGERIVRTASCESRVSEIGQLVLRESVYSSGEEQSVLSCFLFNLQSRRREHASFPSCFPFHPYLDSTISIDFPLSFRYSFRFCSAPVTFVGVFVRIMHTTSRLKYIRVSPTSKKAIAESAINPTVRF